MFTSKPKKIDTSFTIDFKYVLKRILYRTENKLFEKELIDFLEEPIKKSLFYSEFLKEINCQNEKSNNINLDKYNHLDEYINRYLDMKLKQNRIDTFSSSSIGLSVKSLRKLEKEILKIKKQLPEDKLEELEKYYIDIKQMQYLEKELSRKRNSIKNQLELILNFLVEQELLESDYSLTKLGYTVAGINDCNPLILGNLIKNRYFDDLEFSEIVALLSIFIKDKKLDELYFGDLNVDKKFKNMLKNIDRMCCNLNNLELKLNRNLNYNFNFDYNISLTMFNVVKSWAEGKRWNEIEQHYKKSYEGHFVRNILRLNSLIKNVNNIAKLNNDNVLLNKLDGYQEKLIRDIVINDSLYS